MLVSFKWKTGLLRVVNFLGQEVERCRTNNRLNLYSHRCTMYMVPSLGLSMKGSCLVESGLTTEPSLMVSKVK